jgi:hypothetical protein
VFSANISKAYPATAAVKSWVRSYSLKDVLNIEDRFELTELNAANKINFLVWAKPDISKAGVVLLTKDAQTVTLNYDAALFTATVETVPLTDQRLTNVWGNEIYRVTLTAKKQQLKGTYRFVIAKQ